MKTEWRFPFEAVDLSFEREHKFIGRTNAQVSKGEKCPGQLEFEVRICPGEHRAGNTMTQAGSLYIALPLGPDEAKPLAYMLASLVSERIAFQYGDFRLTSSVVSCRCIPETPEEQAEIGDEPYIVHMTVEEVLEPLPFDSKSFTEFAGSKVDNYLLSEFNSAKRERNVISQFLRYFRIIESIVVSESPAGTLKQTLTGNARLQEIVAKELDVGDPSRFLENIVERRHECAHLKLDKDFGYIDADPRIGDELRPLVPMVQHLARRLIEGA